MFAFNDQCAIGFLQTVRDAGVRVPGELSLVGYDDSRLAHASWTRLTTVGQDTAALAEGAVTRALARIRPADRASTDRPRGAGAGPAQPGDPQHNGPLRRHVRRPRRAPSLILGPVAP